MTSKILFLLACLFTVTMAKAQPPVLASNTNGLQAGYSEQFSYRSTSSIDPGPGGPNQVWDFSAFTPSYTITNFFKTCAESPYCGVFPGSNIVEEDSLDFGSGTQQQYSYYFADDTMIALAGQHTSTSFVYDQNEVVLKFPFSYLGSFQSGYAYADSFSPGDYTVGIDSVLADGYGTLKTPVGTFNNVLRVKTVRTFFDSTSTGNVVENEKDYFYRWYSPQYRDYLFTYEEYEPSGGSGLTVGYTKQTGLDVNNIAEPSASFQVSPNPASGLVTAKFFMTAEQQGVLALSDISGKTVYTSDKMLRSGINEVTIDVSKLPAGIYSLRLTTAGNSNVCKVVVR